MQFACFDSVTGLQEAPDQVNFGCGSRTCPANYTCTEYDPMAPLLSSGFGNIGTSLLSCFQVITVSRSEAALQPSCAQGGPLLQLLTRCWCRLQLSSWVHIMYRVMDNTGVAAFLFFVMVVLLEAYYVVSQQD